MLEIIKAIIYGIVEGITEWLPISSTGHPVSYTHLSPNMGTDEEFRELVQDIHNRGMHIVIDGVFNHCSWYFPQFSDCLLYTSRCV